MLPSLIARCIPTLAFCSALALVGCGKEVARGGVRAPHEAAKGARVSHRVDPTDILPEDLDIVVRIDVARMRSQLGAVAASDLEAHAIGDPAEALLLGAIQKADVVWLALRAGDFEAGDRVIVVEGRFPSFLPDAREWHAAPSANGQVEIFDRALGPRARTARIVALGDRALAFISPVEVDAVARVLKKGADEKRGDPSADGLLSVDVHAHPLPLPLERKFPSFASLIGGLDRVRATAVLVDDGLQIDATVVGRGQGDADRARQFLTALRDNLDDARFATLKAAKLDVVGSALHVQAVVPAKILLGLLGG